ncbi:MAG: hypothetical protein QM817_31145 [Archangium sp.]
MPETPKPPAAPKAPAAPPAPAPKPVPVAFTHTKQPDWGVGLVLKNEPEDWILFFENGGEKKLKKKFANDMLTPATLAPDALAALTARAHGRKVKAAPKPSAGLLPKARVKTGPTARFATFKEQQVLFEKLFVGGFKGETYVKEERESKDAAIELAQRTLSKEAFEKGTTDSLFEAARAVLAATNLVFPIEGPIPFRQLAGADREAAIAGLKNLLHGKEAYGDRLAKFAGALNLKDGKSEPKKVSWTLATYFGALFDPKQYICVKPTAFANQALTYKLPADKSAPIDAAGYGQFLAVVEKTKTLLAEAGHEARDLLDVYTFIWRTQGYKAEA